MYRVLRKGGVAIVTIAPVLAAHGYALFNQFVTILKIPGFSHTLQYFETTDSIRKKFLSQGFKHVQSEGCFFGPFPWLSRVVSKKTMAKLLHRYEPLDNTLQTFSFLKNFSNHLIVFAQK
jgi:hypothetical protein